ncbi:MAG: aminoacyl-tRNA hydrolase [Candidatus Omnitrophica bacterium]|nr:aminoacyl-tRNA hydrolase [Candidatus Omnitrophota bacterium]
MKLIVGLGNATDRYAGTRHNVGMEVVRELARRHGVGFDRSVSGIGARETMAVYADWKTSDGIVHLLCPLTMMNASGEALKAATRWRIQPEATLIVCDDVNLPLGRLRLRAGGSDGGHHGLASCLEALGTQAVPRLRIGVGREPLPKDLNDFVLSPFAAEEQRLVDEALTRAMDACELWAAERIQTAMNRVNKKEVRGESGV